MSALCKALASVSSLLGARSCPASEAGWGPEEGPLPADRAIRRESRLLRFLCFLAWPYTDASYRETRMISNKLSSGQCVNFPREDRFQTSPGVVIEPIDITVAHCLRGSASCALRSEGSAMARYPSAPPAAELEALSQSFPSWSPGGFGSSLTCSSLCSCHCWRLAHWLSAEYCHWSLPVTPASSQT